MRKEKLIIIFTVLVDVIGFGIVIPILPFYVTGFGASATIVTLLFASFSFSVHHCWEQFPIGLAEGPY
jgi:DHA1 family tetracycline resistance protein-like MFS transporter